MALTDIGKVANEEWEKSVGLRPDMNLTLGAYIVMPDHFHGILTIGSNEFNSGRSVMHHGPTMHYGPYKNKFSNQSKNLASVLGGFKSAVTIPFTNENKK